MGDTDVGSTAAGGKKVDGPAPTPQPPLNNSPEEFPALNASQVRLLGIVFKME